jgi:hypothetical protein
MMSLTAILAAPMPPLGIALRGMHLAATGLPAAGIQAATVGTTERFDDVANSHTGRANATARYQALRGMHLAATGLRAAGIQAAAM